MLDFSKGLKYPWGNAKRLWNILWILLPILGWLALIGYSRRVTLSMFKGDFKGLPEFGKFVDNLVEGFYLFFKMLPLLIVANLVGVIPYIGDLVSFFVQLFVVPYLLVNLLVTNKFSATYDFAKLKDVVFGNLSDYVIAILKTIGYQVIYLLACVVLIGIPCLSFSGHVYVVDFYKRNETGKTVVKKTIAVKKAPKKKVKKKK